MALFVLLFGLILGTLVAAQNNVNGLIDNGNSSSIMGAPPPDTTSPEITLVSYTPQNPDDSHMIRINCSIYDSQSNINSAMIYYREVGVVSWNSTGLIKVNYEGSTEYEVELGLYDAGFSVEFYIFAVDGSSASNTATEDNGGLYYTFTVIASDVTGPIISTVYNTPNPHDNSTVVFNCQVTDDDSAIESVILLYRVNSGSWITEEMIHTTGNEYSYTHAAFTYEDFVEYQINATDDALEPNFTVNDNEGLFFNFTVRKYDIYAPSITNIQFSPAAPYSNALVNITCTVTDEHNGIYSVILHYRKNNESWIIAQMTLVSDDTYLVQIGVFEAGDIVDFYISAKDDSEWQNEVIDTNHGLYYSFTVVENTNEAGLFVLLPLFALASLGLVSKRRK